jgi:NitT/TauT family transport system substrate-binding protein
VAARLWFAGHGLVPRERGGDLTILPLANPDQLLMFRKREIHAAWTVEPWVSRLVQEGGGKVFLEEGDLWPDRRYVTTHLIVAKRFLDEHPDLVRAWIEEHVRLTDWINANRQEAMAQLNAEIKRETGKSLPDSVLVPAFARLTLTDDPVSDSLMKSAEDAYALGFLGKEKPRLSGIYDLAILNEIRKALGRPPVR